MAHPSFSDIQDHPSLFKYPTAKVWIWTDKGLGLDLTSAYLTTGTCVSSLSPSLSLLPHIRLSEWKGKDPPIKHSWSLSSLQADPPTPVPFPSSASTSFLVTASLFEQTHPHSCCCRDHAESFQSVYLAQLCSIFLQAFHISLQGSHPDCNSKLCYLLPGPHRSSGCSLTTISGELQDKAWLTANFRRNFVPFRNSFCLYNPFPRPSLTPGSFLPQPFPRSAPT